MVLIGSFHARRFIVCFSMDSPAPVRERSNAEDEVQEKNEAAVKQWIPGRCWECDERCNEASQLCGDCMRAGSMRYAGCVV